MARSKKNNKIKKEEPIEKQLWKSADKLRKNIDAAEYKHIVLGLIFLKYISDAFEGLYQKLLEGKGEYSGADPEDRDEYKAENVFFVPQKARWPYIQKQAKLFLNTQIPASLWFLSRNKSNGGYRNRTDEILFIDARNEGHLINRRTRELSAEDVQRIADTYHEWRASTGSATAKGKYEDIPGFCKSAAIDEVRKLDYVLTPGRYVGLAVEEDDFDFIEKFISLKKEFKEQLKEEERLNREILKNLEKVKVT